MFETAKFGTMFKTNKGRELVYLYSDDENVMFVDKHGITYLTYPDGTFQHWPEEKVEVKLIRATDE